jgi:hypothetical protein
VEINPNQLPSDPAALRQMVMGLLGEAMERERKLRQLQHWVEQLLRARYGPRRERVDENQLFMFAAEIMARGEDSSGLRRNGSASCGCEVDAPASRAWPERAAKIFAAATGGP